jgi:hypothetical protein
MGGAQSSQRGKRLSLTPTGHMWAEPSRGGQGLLIHDCATRTTHIGRCCSSRFGSARLAGLALSGQFGKRSSGLFEKARPRLVTSGTLHCSNQLGRVQPLIRPSVTRSPTYSKTGTQTQVHLRTCTCNLHASCMILSLAKGGQKGHSVRPNCSAPSTGRAHEIWSMCTVTRVPLYPIRTTIKRPGSGIEFSRAAKRVKQSWCCSSRFGSASLAGLAPSVGSKQTETEAQLQLRTGAGILACKTL